MLSEFEDHVTISSSTNDARNGGRWARSGTAGEAKAWAHRAGLTHAARIHSLRASRRGPGAGAAAGARCRPVCPRARARNEPAQNGGLVGGARGPTSGHLAIAQRSAPLELLACSVSTPGRSLSDTVGLCPRLVAQATARPVVQNTVMPGFSGPKTSQSSLQRPARHLSSPPFPAAGSHAPPVSSRLEKRY